MNELAHIVHDLVTDREATCQVNLARFEKEALADLRHLLRHSPRVLADILDQRPTSADWPPASITTRAWIQAWNQA